MDPDYEPEASSARKCIWPGLNDILDTPTTSSAKEQDSIPKENVPTPEDLDLVTILRENVPKRLVQYYLHYFYNFNRIGKYLGGPP